MASSLRARAAARSLRSRAGLRHPQGRVSREFAAGGRARYARLPPRSLGSLATLVPLSRAFRGSRWLFPCRFAPLPL